MKKMYIIVLILVSFAFESYANMQTTGWRWRNDDGDEATATWKASDTVAVTIGPDEVIRLRVRYDNPYGGDEDNYVVSGLKYAVKDTIDSILNAYTGTDEYSMTGDDEHFIALGEFAFFDFVASEHVADQAVTTDQSIVYGSTYEADHQTTWSDGVFMSVAADYTLTHGTYTEVEYCIKPTEHCESGTYYFLGGGGGNIIYPLDTKYERFPELTVDRTIGIKKQDLKQNIKVYASEGNIKIFSVPQGDVSISVYNLAGSMIAKLETNSIGEVINVPAKDLSVGMYIVNVKSAEGTFIKKFIHN